MSNSNPLKRAFDLYMSDLSYNEIERLIKRDAAEVYDFFASDIPKADQPKNKLIRALIFVRSLFNAFLLKLKPAHRLFYLVAIVIFFIGYVQGIGSYVIFGFLIMNGLLVFELADKLVTKDELQVARKIQSKLMPTEPKDNHHFDISAFYQSAKEIGGDYFDIIQPEGKDKSYIVVGDISGKGVAAALYMVRVQAIIRLLVNSFDTIGDIFKNLKKYFSENLQKDYFLTLIGTSIDSDGNLTIASAGHNPVLYYKASSKTTELINPKGMGIGLNDKGMFEQTLEELNLSPSPNDILIFYTDGLTEAMDTQNNQFGIERLEKLIENNSDKNSAEIKNLISRNINDYIGSNYQHDDLTFVVLKKK